MSKMGRPNIEISQEQFEKLCAFLCTLEDIASFFDCSADTIERWCKRIFKVTFAEAYKKGSSQGRISLRRKQFEVAMSGNVTMLIWLGKQHLAQRDKSEVIEQTTHSADPKLQELLLAKAKSLEVYLKE